MRDLTATILLLLALAAAVPASGDSLAGAWPGVTVLLDDGWRFRDVTVYRDAKGAGFWVLREDGAERLVAADRIASVVGPDGADLTDRVLAGERGPGRATGPATGSATVAAPAPAAPAASPVQESPPDPPREAVPSEQESGPMLLAFTVESGWGMPDGDWFGGQTADWSAGARLRVGTVQSSYLALGARFQQFGGPEGGATEAPEDAAVYEFTFGWLSSSAPTGARLYLELGVGLIQNRYLRDEAGGIVVRRTDSSGAFVGRGGLMVPWFGAISLDLGASVAYRGLLFKRDDEPAATLPALHLGLTWRN